MERLQRLISDLVDVFAKGAVEPNPRFDASVAVFRSHDTIDAKRIGPCHECVEHLCEIEKPQGIGRTGRYREGTGVVVDELAIFFRNLCFNQALQFGNRSGQTRREFFEQLVQGVLSLASIDSTMLASCDACGGVQRVVNSDIDVFKSLLHLIGVNDDGFWQNRLGVINRGFAAVMLNIGHRVVRKFFRMKTLAFETKFAF